MIATFSCERESRISTLTISATKSGRISRTWAAISGSFHVSAENFGSVQRAPSSFASTELASEVTGNFVSGTQSAHRRWLFGANGFRDRAAGAESAAGGRIGCIGRLARQL